MNAYGKLKRIMTVTIAAITKTSLLRGFRNIRTKLILAFSVPIAFLVIQGFISYIGTSKAVSGVIGQSSVSTVESSSKYLEAVMTSIDNIIFQLSVSQDVQNYTLGLSDTTDGSDMLTENKLEANIEKNLMNISVTNQYVENVLLIAGGNKMITSDNSKNTPSVALDDVKNTDFYKKVLASDRGSWLGLHPEIDKITGNTASAFSMSESRVIKNLNAGLKTGLIIVNLKPDFINKLLTDINLGKGSEVHLISPDGRDMTNLGDSAKNTNISGLDFYKKISTSMSDNGKASVRYRNSEYLMCYSQIGDTGYRLAALIPSAQLNSAARTIFATTVILVPVAILIAMGIGVLMANSMNSTIKRIIDATGKAASGDLSMNFTSRRKDELGTLLKSVNTMISSMRDLIAQARITSGRVADSAWTVASTSDRVSRISHEITYTIQEISGGASAQAADAEQGVQKIGYLAHRINNVAENARSIDRLTLDTKEMTGHGMASILDLEERSERTNSISREVMQDIQLLDEHSKSIGKIINVIGKIADRTNLLALNAAIEAARAGEMGKGFAVVADEVRKLAEQSMKAAHEIAAIIRTIQDEMGKMVVKVESTETILKSQNEAVMNTKHVFGSIKNSMETLADQVEQIMARIVEMEENKEQAMSSIQNISAVSEQTAASSEEVAAATQEQLSGIEELANNAKLLGDAAKDLEQAISRFKLE